MEQTEIRYKRTMHCCFTAYVIQAIVNTYVPLLFVTFQREFQISLQKITFLITLNFCTQLLIDFLSAFFVDYIGYKVAVCIAHIMCAIGFFCLAVLPYHLQDPFFGIAVGIFLYAIGGGLIEVLISPIIENIPSKNKEKTMSMLHSFFNWGQVAVVLFSTVFFMIAGRSKWGILTLIWAVLPVVNCIRFVKAPIVVFNQEEKVPLKSLVSKRLFWLFFLMMVCAGASEQTICQWASTFAEEGLRISKSAGDLVGTMTFALLMGLSRFYYGTKGNRIDLGKFMEISAFFCIVSYGMASFFSSKLLNLFGCALSGFTIGIMWPGTFSLASVGVPGGGTAMFAWLALGGDIGCAAGPTVAGLVSNVYKGNLKTGIAVAIVFPLTMLLCAKFIREKER